MTFVAISRLAVCGLLALASVATAQTSTKSYRIAVLGQGNPPTDTAQAADLRQGLRDRGYSENKNVTVEFRYAGGNVEKLREHADELVRMNVDVIITLGDPAAFAAKKATTTIPIVATEFGSDPVKAGLVASLGRPGGNVTGLSSITEELWQKRLASLREFMPRVRRVSVLVNPGNSGNALCLSGIRAAGSESGIQIQPIEVTDGKSIDRAFAAITKDAPDALATCWDTVTLEYAQAIADFAIKRRLALIAPLREYATAGALLSFGINLSAHRRRAAYYVDKIFKGAKPGDLSVEQPTIFELVVNVSTAKALGLTLPPTIAVLADDLIQ
jgi:putative ABC transport system substrate-binding protein